VIRPATAADLELVRAISYEAYAPYESLLGGLPLPAMEDYAPRIAAGQVWLLGDAGLLVLERHADHALLFSVAVRPAAHGTGLGRTLLDEAERLSAGLPELRLYTNALMTRNQAIYAKRGFIETGRRPHPLRPAFTVVDMTKRLDVAETELRRLLDVMARLRAPDGCPWDQVQDFDSIAPYTIEEAYEVADAIARRDWAALPDELGDLLFQVVYHARMAEEAGRFDFATVARLITDKMIRRHPDVFAGGSVAPGFWEAQKTAERIARRDVGTLAGVAANLPALTRATKLTARAARVGFDWPDAAAVLDKLAEETAELQAELPAADPARLEDELGDMLFVLANLARKLNLDPERCLAHANAKFTRRFEAVEALLAAEGQMPADAGLDAMEAAWRRVKAAES
jgi:nucleoside triphosphate diphosphatase